MNTKNSNSIAPLKTKNLSDEKANSMAIYFENNITASDLAYWLSLANSYCAAFPDQLKIEGKESNAASFLNYVGMFLLPELIACKNRKQRIELLKNEIISIFDTNNYEGSKQALSDIGASFMKSFVKYTDSSDGVTNFMNTYNYFLFLTGKYRDYCILRNEDYKNKIAA